MDVNLILKTYDGMFQNNTLEEIEEYLVGQINKAKRLGYKDILFTLLNEYIGYLRDTTQKEKGLYYAYELRLLLKSLDINNTYEYATCLLNIANAYRAFNKHKESLILFKECESVYLNLLSADDYSFANLYNNFGLLYQELQNYTKSIEILLKALKVVDQYEQAIIPQAVTRTNLAVSYIQLKNDTAYEQAIIYLNEALNVFKDYPDDFHYNAALAAYGDALMYKKQYSQASQYYQQGLKELERHAGKNDNYKRIEEKYNYALSLSQKSNLELSHHYFINKVRTLFIKEFGDDYKRMAFGMVGEGSDCYGFDDEISKDHDLGIGFCIWLNQEDYKRIGSRVEVFYNSIFEHKGLLKKRRGVFNINDFYNELLDTDCDYENNAYVEYSDIEEYRLSMSTNGLVFEDQLGLFTHIREAILNYYPDSIYRQKLANALHYYSQYAQSNYQRMIDRIDYISASLCKTKAIETTIDIIYLLNKQYAPYYKWKKKGIENTQLGKDIIPYLNQLVLLDINKKEETLELFEIIAQRIRRKLIELKLISGKNLFLEVYIPQILNDSFNNMVEEVIKLEWAMFDNVENIGGRASCQNNYPVFYIMRKSQYLAWNKDVLESYHKDLSYAYKKGYNMITEKYARMMESTDPDEYKRIKEYIPKIDQRRQMIQEEIIKIQVEWMEEFKKQYPRMASNARIIRTGQDSINQTSYETYLRGEISTYSDKTLTLYGYMILERLKEKKNIAYEIMLNTANLYGYETLEEADNKI